MVDDYRASNTAGAEQMRATLAENIKSDDEKLIGREKTTLLMAYDAYRAYYEQKAEERDYGYRKNLVSTLNFNRTFVDQMGADFLVRDVETKHLQEWAGWLNKKPATLTAHARRLSGMLRYAKDYFKDLAQWNVPVIRDYAPDPKNERLRLIAPEEAEVLVHALLNPAPRHSTASVRTYMLRMRNYRDGADIFRIALASGMRAEEIFHLEEDDITKTEIRVCNVGKLADGNVKTTKTRYDRRIPLAPAVLDIVAARRRDGLIEDGRVFSERWKTNFYDNRVHNALKLAAKEAGLTYSRDEQEVGFTLHDARATWCTAMLRNHPLADVMRWSGHKTLEAFRRYLRPLNGEFEKGRDTAQSLVPFADKVMEIIPAFRDERPRPVAVPAVTNPHKTSSLHKGALGGIRANAAGGRASRLMGCAISSAGSMWKKKLPVPMIWQCCIMVFHSS